MTSIRDFIKRRPLLTYFALAFALSWGGILLALGPRTLAQGPLTMPQALTGWALMLLGSGGVGLLMTGLVEGRAGLRALRARMTVWPAGIGWYALLLVPALLAIAVFAVLRPFSPAFVPTALAEPNHVLVAILFVVAGFGACVEELGWTAFATPRLLERRGVLASGLALGALWGLWHVLINTSHAALYGGLFVPHLLVMGDGILPLIAYRVLMVWAYRHTGSLPLGMLLHVFYTAILVTLGPSGVTPAQQLLYDALFLSALGFAVTAIVILANHRRLTRQPPLRERVT